VSKKLAVATHACVASVKDSGFVDVIGMCEPVPVLEKLDIARNFNHSILTGWYPL
jgi:hypothetical protein